MPSPGDDRPTLLTTGYEQHPAPESLVERLRAANVEVLLDVRDLPRSRRRGFSKTALAEALGRAGIAYRHERSLGNPKPGRDLWRYGDRPAGERLYRAHLADGAQPTLDALSRALTQELTCLLCVEADHRDCHRSIVAEELGRRVPRLRVEHL